MTVFTSLLRKDIKLFFKDWKAVLLLLLTPVLFIAFFTYSLSPYLNKKGFIEPFTIAIVDRENTTQTRILIKQLEEMEIFSEILKVDNDKAEELIRFNMAAAAIILPDDFTASVSIGENSPVTVIGNTSMPLESLIVRNLVQSAANLVSAGQSAINTIYYYNEKAGLKGEALWKQYSDSTMKVVLETLSRNSIFSRYEPISDMDVTPVEYFTAALLVVFLMFAGMPAMKMMVSERTLGLTRRLAGSPVKMWQVVLSKLIVSLVLSVMQFSIVIVLTAVLFNNYWGAPLKNILILLGGIIFSVSSWSIFVSAVSTSQASADIVGNLGILLMAVIGGCIYPLSSMPEFVRIASKLTINRWAMEGFIVLFSGNHALGVMSQVLALLVIGTVFLTLAAVLLRMRRE